MTIDLILGTAGHIDHGKTALVRALTGTDTDRLPEEKRRGITIELGFAELELGEFRLGIVDVPGHERFVRNMLAGATGVDVALLVVAADDSVKPQTREHLEILRLLELEVGLIAVTKCDLADPDWLDLVEEDIAELVAGTFLDGAPMIRTSATTGQGIDALRVALEEAAARAARSERRRRADGPFRMAVDRTFTVAGHGTVVTGSVSTGLARLGDELLIEPGAIPVRVRGLQNHARSVEQVQRGQRAAVNLAGIHHEQLVRGHELATPGHLIPSRRLTVALRVLESARRPIKHRARIRLHVGTAELLARVALPDRDELQPGEESAAQLFLSRPAATTWGQPLVVRSESPVVTIGGGTVLDTDAPRLRRRDEGRLDRLADLRSADPVIRASAATYFAGLRPWQPADLARIAGVDDVETVHGELLARGELREIVVSPTRTLWVHDRALDELADRIERILAKMHAGAPLRPMVDRSSLVRRFRHVEKALVETVLADMEQAGRIRATQRGLALADHQPRLSENERKLIDHLVQSYRDARFTPPTVGKLQDQTTRNRAAVPELIAVAADLGRLVAIGPDLYLHADVERELRQTMVEHLAEGPGLTISRIREILETTRKYAVPLCEYLDRVGVTRREGDVRVGTGD